VVGDLTLNYESLTVTDDPQQSPGLHTAEPGSPSEQALRLLASWVNHPAPQPAGDGPAGHLPAGHGPARLRLPRQLTASPAGRRRACLGGGEAPT
jgi:hypothetical protein